MDFLTMCQRISSLVLHELRHEQRTGLRLSLGVCIGTGLIAALVAHTMTSTESWKLLGLQELLFIHVPLIIGIIGYGCVASANPRNPATWQKTIPMPPAVQLTARLAGILCTAVLPVILIFDVLLAATFPAARLPLSLLVFSILWCALWAGAWLGTMLHNHGWERNQYLLLTATSLIGPSLVYGIAKAFIGRDPIGFGGTRAEDFALNLVILLVIFSLLLPAWCIHAWRKPLTPLRLRWHAPALLVIIPFANVVRTTDFLPTGAATATQINPANTGITARPLAVMDKTTTDLLALTVTETIPATQVISDMRFVGKILEVGSARSWRVEGEGNTNGRRPTGPGFLREAFHAGTPRLDFDPPHRLHMAIHLTKPGPSSDETMMYTLNGKTVRLIGTLYLTGRYISSPAPSPDGPKDTLKLAYATYQSGDVRASGDCLCAEINAKYLQLAGLIRPPSPRVMMLREDLGEIVELWPLGFTHASGELLFHTQKVSYGIRVAPHLIPAARDWATKAKPVILDSKERHIVTPVDLTITFPGR